VVLQNEVLKTKKEGIKSVVNEEIKEIKSSMNEIALHNLKYIILGGIL